MNHILPTHKKGDTFQGELFQMNLVVSGVPEPIDLTDVLICMDVRPAATKEKILRLTNYETGDLDFPGGGITINDPTGGLWQIDKQIIDVKPGQYVYDIQFTFDPEGTPEIITYIEGTWTFVQDVTYEVA